jgi:hypothetical protein
MIEIVIRVYDNPPKLEEIDELIKGIPEDFTGIAVLGNLGKLSSDEEEAKVERKVLEYTLPRLQAVMKCMVTGEPVAAVVLSADAEDQMSQVIKEVLIQSALNDKVNKMMLAPMKGAHVQ